MGVEERVVLQQLLRLHQILFHLFQTVVPGKVVMHTGDQLLLAVRTTCDLPTGRGLTPIINESLKTKMERIFIAYFVTWRQRVGSLPHLIPGSAFRPTARIKRLLHRRDRTVGMPSNRNGLSVAGIRFKVQDIVFAVREPTDIVGTLRCFDRSGQFSVPEAQSHIDRFDVPLRR